MADPLVEEVRRSASWVAEAEAALARARAHWRRAIYDATVDGASTRDIAAAAGVTTQRVYQIRADEQPVDPEGGEP